MSIKKLLKSLQKAKEGKNPIHVREALYALYLEYLSKDDYENAHTYLTATREWDG